MKPLLIVAIFIVAAGCETTPPPQVPLALKIPDVRDDMGLVFVMRFGLGLRMINGSVPIYVDNQKVFAVKDWRYTYIWVTPGPHQFKAEWSALEKPRFEGNKFDASTLDLDVEAGKAYFLNYQIVQEGTVPTPMETLNPFAKSKVISAGLILETHFAGRDYLSHCTYQENQWR